jgi:hypothetical protein
MATALLVLHIEDILVLRSKKQMLGVDATWNVASMQNVQTFGDFPIVKLPGEPVHKARIGTFENSVAANVDGRSPQPAACIRFWAHRTKKAYLRRKSSALPLDVHGFPISIRFFCRFLAASQ